MTKAGHRRFPAPWRALALVSRGGVRRADLLGMLGLALGRAALESLATLLFALVLYLLLGLGRLPDWLNSFQVSMSGLSAASLLAWLILSLVLCKVVLAPWLGQLRRRRVDDWSLRLSMAALRAELQPQAGTAQPRPAQGRNLTVNYVVNRVVLAGVFPCLDLLTEALVVAALLVYLGWHLPWVAGLLLGVLLLAGGLLLVLQRMLQREPGGQRLALQERMQRWVVDSGACLREIRLYRRIPAVLQGYRPMARRFAELASRERAQGEVQGPIVELLLLLLLGGLAYGLRNFAAHQVDVQALALSSAIGVRLLPAMRRMFMAWQSLRHVQADIEHLHVLLDRGQESAARPSTFAVEALPARQLLACTALGFRYPGANGWLLQGLDLRLLRGEKLGLVGISGVGKSTFVDLLIGQLDPDEGRLAWACEPVIGYAGAQTTLLPSSLRDNVRLLGQEATDTQVGEALAIAGLSSWLAKLPAGLDTPADQFEQRLSSGERQRLGLARAVLHAEHLLILDEATSALDELTEGSFLDALAAARPDLTVLLITHRLSALRHAERAVRLHEGRLEPYPGDSLGRSTSLNPVGG